MENNDILLKPTPIYAFLKGLPFMVCSGLFILLAWKISPSFIWFSLFAMTAALYRYIFVRKLTYCITSEYLCISKGIFFKRIDQVELYRVKDYIITQPPMIQLFGLINVTLKSTNPENPVIAIMGIQRSDLIDELRKRVQQARRNNLIYEIN
jgi:uncharacterized membrane protein YdbT with pleckstrin-like domain